MFKILVVEGLSQILDLKMNSVDCLKFKKVFVNGSWFVVS